MVHFTKLILYNILSHFQYICLLFNLQYHFSKEKLKIFYIKSLTLELQNLQKKNYYFLKDQYSVDLKLLSFVHT